MLRCVVQDIEIRILIITSLITTVTLESSLPHSTYKASDINNPLFNNNNNINSSKVGNLHVESPNTTVPINNVNFTTVVYNCSNTSDVTLQPVDKTAGVFVTILLSIVVAVTIFGNLLIIAAVMTFHELQTITNMFVASLACADLIMGTIVLPVGIPYVLTGKWTIGKLFCDIWISIDVLTVTASIETLCAIALDRYFAITRPFTYSTCITKTRAKCIIAAIWITSAGIGFIPIQLGWWKQNSPKANCCYNNPECCEFITNESYVLFSSCVSFYIPLIIMIFSYIIVFKEAIRHASQIDDRTGIFRRASMPGSNTPLWNRQQRRTVFTMGYIMGIFTLCWLPFFIVNILKAFCIDCIEDNVFTALNWIGYSNSFFNPFIYCHNRQFRRAFGRLLSCVACSEGLERTKRASLSDSFPRYKRDSQRESTLDMVTNFFLPGGSSRKKSRKSASSGILKRESTISNGSYKKHPSRKPHFQIGSQGVVLSNIKTTSNNNNLESGKYDTAHQDVEEYLFLKSNVNDGSDSSLPLCGNKEEIASSKVMIESEHSDITPSYVYERCNSHEGPQSDEPDDETTEEPKRVFPSRRYSDFESNLKNFALEIKRPSVVEGNRDTVNDVFVIPTKSQRSMSMFGSVGFTRTDERERENHERNGGRELPRLNGIHPHVCKTVL